MERTEATVLIHLQNRRMEKKIRGEREAASRACLRLVSHHDTWNRSISLPGGQSGRKSVWACVCVCHRERVGQQAWQNGWKEWGREKLICRVTDLEAELFYTHAAHEYKHRTALILLGDLHMCPLASDLLWTPSPQGVYVCAFWSI